MPSPAAPATSAPADTGDASPPPRTRPGWKPHIDTTRCTGCGWCVAACDLHLLSLETVRWRKTSTLHAPERCTGCSDCAIACPFHVISMRRAPADGGPPPSSNP